MAEMSCESSRNCPVVRPLALALRNSRHSSFAIEFAYSRSDILSGSSPGVPNRTSKRSSWLRLLASVPIYASRFRILFCSCTSEKARIKPTKPITTVKASVRPSRDRIAPGYATALPAKTALPQTERRQSIQTEARCNC